MESVNFVYLGDSKKYNCRGEQGANLAGFIGVTAYWSLDFFNSFKWMDRIVP